MKKVERLTHADVPYWLEGTGTRYPPLTGDERADAVVVGGGVTGLASARVFAEAGLRVRLLDARRVGSGASGRNGGFALRGFARPYSDLRMPELMRLTEETLERMSQLAGDAFRRAGSLYVFAGEEELEAGRAEHDALATDGFAVKWLERDELPPVLSPHYLGGLFHATDGLLEPGRWVRQLAALATDAGVAIAEETSALALDGTTVTTSRGTVVGEHVVVATDGYTRGLLPELDGVLIPARNQVLATAPLRERYFEPAVYARYGYDYWQQTAGGRIVIGGRRDADLEAEFTDREGTTEVIQRELEALLAQLLGGLPKVTHRWSGLLAFTPDRLPLVGPLPARPRVWAALGYSGHGNVLALACGEEVARAILGRPDPRLALFNPERILGARQRA